jgi:hypothetical protein
MTTATLFDLESEASRTISPEEGARILDLFRNRFGVVDLDRGPLADFRQSHKMAAKRPELMTCLTPNQSASVG